MSERLFHGPQLRFRTVTGYHLHWRGETSLHSDNILEFEAHDAIEAARAALTAVQKFMPSRATVFNLNLSVALIVPTSSASSQENYHD